MADRVEFARMLGFTHQWFTYGVLDDVALEGLEEEWNKGQDDNTEHYRYRAFRDFVAAHRPIAPKLAAALFELGATDPDLAMGGAIMADIARLPECPESVLDAAVATGHSYLGRIVELRRK